MPYNHYDDQEKHTLDEIEQMEQAELAAQKKRFLPARKSAEESDGVSKDEEQIWENPNLKNFFKFIGRKLNPILSVNLMMIFGNFPIFFALFALSGYASIHSTSPYFSAFAPLRGIMYFDQSPAIAALYNVFGLQAEITVLSTVDWICLALSALTIFTIGPVSVGCTYIMRNLFRGEGIFFFHDFFYAIKRNLRQSILYGILDTFIVILLGYDIFFFNLNYEISTPMSMMFFASIFMAILYVMMRPYIYLMLVTFDLSIFKMFKNALLFTILGIKRNILSLLGIIVLGLLEFFILGFYFPLGVILPFVCLLALGMAMQVYAAYPKIKEIMIDPYYAEENNDPEE